MTLFSRYIFRQALGALLMILLSLTAVVWIAMALKQLSLVTSGGAGGLVFLEFTALILPDIMAIIAPIAMLIAALYTLNKLNQDSELIVMTAAGATVWGFARPLLILAVLISGWLLLANFLVSPWSQRKLSDLVNQMRTDLISQVLQPGNFASPEEGLTFHIRERDGAGHMLGILMSDTRSQTEQLTYIANSGEVFKKAGKAYLVLHDGKVVRRAAKQDTSIIEFDSYVLDLATAAAKGGSEELKPHARYLGELLNPPPDDSYYRSNPGSFRAEIHERFVSLLYPLVFIAIVVAYLGQARTNRQSRGQAQVAAFSFAAGLKLAGIAAGNLFSANPSAIVLVYGLPVGGLVIAVSMANMSMRPLRKSRLRQRFDALAERVAGGAMQALRPILTLRRGAS
jgi:lipopolysaccharide export system permease protein